MQVIGIGGLAQAGKTTVAHMLADCIAERKLGKPVMAHFAGPLKRASEAIGADKSSNPELYRKFCQEVGNNMRDPDYVPGVTGPDYWVNLCRSTLQHHANLEADQYRNEKYCDLPLWRISNDKYTPWGEHVVILDDVRYPNEVSLVRQYGGILLFIDAYKRLDLDDPIYDHPSEQLAKDWYSGKDEHEVFDWVVPNHLDYEDLKAIIGTEMEDMLLCPELL